MLYRSVKIPIENKLISDVRNYLKTHNLANRGKEDGSRKKQEVGLIGELAVDYYLLGTYPDLSKKLAGFDGGYDLVFQGKRIDVKTMERNSYVMPHFVNNFYIMQKEYHCDLLVFCSYHSTDKVVEICGYMPKKELSARGTYFGKGTKRKRADGTTFMFRQSNYEIKNKDLDDIEKLKKMEFTCVNS